MKQLLVALDVDTTAEAVALADQLRGSVGGFTIGNRRVASEGPAVVEAIVLRVTRNDNHVVRATTRIQRIR